MAITKDIVVGYNAHKDAFLDDWEDYSHKIISKDEFDLKKADFKAYCQQDDIKELLYTRQKRSRIRLYYDCMQVYAQSQGMRVYWWTLTFDNDHLKDTEKKNLQNARHFLEKFSNLYIIVIEYGEKDNRLHLHGFMVADKGITAEWFKWHSREDLQDVSDWITKSRAKATLERRKRTNYLAKYVSKQMPRLRPTKKLSRITKEFRKIKRLSKHNSWTCKTREEQMRWLLQSLDLRGENLLLCDGIPF